MKTTQTLLKSALIGLSVLFASVATAKTITVEHQMGKTTLESKPQNVVVLGQDSLDVLDAIGVEPVGVVKAHLPSYLSKYKGDKYKAAGSLFEPNFEAIYNMKPDLIIVSNRSSGSMEELSKIAPTVLFLADSKDYWGSTQKAWRMLGKIFEKEQKVEELIASQDKQIQALKAANQNGDSRALAIITSGGKVAAFGVESRYGYIHSLFGFKQAADGIEAKSHGEHISYEYISKANPDVLIVLDRDEAIGASQGEARKQLDNALIKKTNAYKNNKITYLNAPVWYITASGVTATQIMIDDMKRAHAAK
ncbi:enterochelin ABC transporter substrate-binding protein [Vibrio nigripulchritudo]|uniref:siderophore ABC transporter substrate-binding protein n=1 Tax=Vibrio TaxID=662 RepID=UPI00190BE63D|nr:MULTISPECIES: siderophore ABC transporter substrate-binding protein [Vibrio]UAB72176.1 siderophore ABC transporter substrate-binding protein [Vibrio sp. SCSIO 43132]BCL72509.1 enterochelin ABC transporter substrate-binding protein [Vibrio nigripulchritudo]BDU33870.1 enterochelin ABC transporter substrate-binding protein [Vibrio nigripulchritudo]